MSVPNESSDCINYKSTPPTNRKVRNPFDRGLIDRLHKPICSPGMCKIYKKKSKCSFRWDIDQACTLVPTEIVACNSQFEPSPDPMLEKIAEEATEKFFSQEMVMPSPHESSKKPQPLFHTSTETSIQITSIIKQNVPMKDVSAQTILTLPPELPPDIEKLLKPFCTYTQEQNVSDEYEITANGSLRRKLFFEEHSDMEHYDSEHTDEEAHLDARPPSSYEAHTPLIFSPDLSQNAVTKEMKRTFDTPLNKRSSEKPYKNKILDVVDFGEPSFSPIVFHTPDKELEVASLSSLASASISPVTKVTSSDEEKNNFTSPESEAMATCLDCIGTQTEKRGPCFCKKTPNKSALQRSASLKEYEFKESPPRSRKSSFSFSERRSLSMSSLHRSRSVQKLDFSMDMSVDGSFHDHSQADSESSSPKDEANKNPSQETTWTLAEESNIKHLAKEETFQNHSQDIQSSTKLVNTDENLDDTPIKGKCISSVLSHEIRKIRAPVILSPVHMSLDSSLDTSDHVLSLEDKKIDFNNIDLKFLTENASQFECTANATKVGGDISNSFKRLDSGFNENTTFYTNTSSYYESAIKPSELTVTNMSRLNTGKTALKEISNVPWTRFDSGFKDENSVDSIQFYSNEIAVKKASQFRYSEAKLEHKENIATAEFDPFLVQSSTKGGMSMSEIFTEDMTFNCNFSSTPSKNKSKKVNS